MSRIATIVGPEDHGRPMSLAEFDHVEVRAGYLYELSRGVITVSDVPKKKHMKQANFVRRKLDAFLDAHPGVANIVNTGTDCKILAEGFDSERHPDLAVYKTEAPDTDDIWSVWVPEIVIEVVSPGSEKRDYEEKPPEYLAFGVAEYWIFDEPAQKVTVMRRVGGVWKTRVLSPADKLTTILLPGFELDIAA